MYTSQNMYSDEKDNILLQHKKKKEKKTPEIGKEND